MWNIFILCYSLMEMAFCFILNKHFRIFGIWICLSQPHFGISVRMKLTPPKVGGWSPPGLSKTQSSSSKVKTPCIKVFFISMERSWSVDAQNGLACAIWTFVAQVMSKRRAKLCKIDLISFVLFFLPICSRLYFVSVFKVIFEIIF